MTADEKKQYKQNALHAKHLNEQIKAEQLKRDARAQRHYVSSRRLLNRAGRVSLPFSDFSLTIPNVLFIIVLILMSANTIRTVLLGHEHNITFTTLLSMFQSLQETGINFDVIYDKVDAMSGFWIVFKPISNMFFFILELLQTIFKFLGAVVMFFIMP